MSLTVGASVGGYRIVEQLGQGGMATVFKAYHAALDRYVAIKVMHPAFKEDPNFLARFQREARVVAKLEHPNIVPIYDFAEQDGAPYLVMKFIEGETLKARLAREPLTLPESLRILEAVGAGLDYAHKQGILHRDIKPSNVMLAADSGIYLADFGLARIAQAGESTLSSDSMLGTPQYMSPEQAKGIKDLDGRTDIYSLGVVLYELVVGRLPFSADTPYAIIHDHIYSPLPMPHNVNPNVPEEVERVLLKALAKERADRYQDVAMMVAAFREAAAGTAPQVIALPRSVPVSPTAPTASPSGVTVKGEPAGEAPSLAPTQAGPAKKGYTFAWWHPLVALALLACVVVALFAAAGLARNRRQARAAAANAQATATALAQASALPPAASPLPHPSDTPSAPPLATPPGQDANALLADAEAAFKQGHHKEGLALLDQAVALDPKNTGVRLHAGDLALTNGFALYALAQDYVTGVALEQQAPDGLGNEMHVHASLAFYIAAADPNAADFIRQQAETYPDPGAVGLAGVRYRIFHESGEAVFADLTAAINDSPGNPGLLLLMGDYLLRRGNNAEAARHYGMVVENMLKNPQSAPAWLRREAECNLKKIRDQKANAKLEPSCADPSLLLIGK